MPGVVKALGDSSYDNKADEKPEAGIKRVRRDDEIQGSRKDGYSRQHQDDSIAITYSRHLLPPEVRDGAIECCLRLNAFIRREAREAKAQGAKCDCT